MCEINTVQDVERAFQRLRESRQRHQGRGAAQAVDRRKEAERGTRGFKCRAEHPKYGTLRLRAYSGFDAGLLAASIWGVPWAEIMSEVTVWDDSSRPDGQEDTRPDDRALI